MKTLKGYVKKKTRPKRSMIERYIIKEALGFSTKYLQDFTTTKRRVWDEEEDQCMFDEMVERNGCPIKLSVNLRNMAHSFVLQNVELMVPWHLYATLNFILNILKFQT